MYYPAGWLLSRVWQYQIRNGITKGEWTWLVLRNHPKSINSAAALELDPGLKDMTHLVEARNDPVNGAGLLFVRHRFFNILVTVESVYEHVLQNPIMLAACLGDLSDKLPDPRYRIEGGAKCVDCVLRFRRRKRKFCI